MPIQSEKQHQKHKAQHKTGMHKHKSLHRQVWIWKEKKTLFKCFYVLLNGLILFYNFCSRCKEETELEVNFNRYVFLTDQFIWAACYSVSWCIYAITPAFLFSTALFHFHIYFLISVYFLRPRMINVVCTGQSQIYKLWPTVCQVYDIKLVSTDLCLKCLGDSIVSLTNDNI